MPQSADRDRLLAAIETELQALESLCGSIERALLRRRWSDLGDAIADSRRVTHALQNAMDDAVSVRDAAFDASVLKRVGRVHAIRDNQMKRLQHYHEAVGERLQMTARWKAALRSIGSAPRASRLASLDRFS